MDKPFFGLLEDLEPIEETPKIRAFKQMCKEHHDKYCNTPEKAREYLVKIGAINDS